MAATDTNATVVTFYDTYKDAGRAPELIALHGVRWLISLFGLSLNATLIAATVKAKHLHHRCNFLIAAEAFANILYQLAPSTTFFLALSGVDFIPLQLCLFLQALPLFGVHCSLLCAFFIGLDRLLSIKFPIWIKQQNRRHYVFILMFFAVLYGAIYVIQCYKLCEWYDYLQLKVMCTITLDCFQGLLVEAKCLYSVLTINIATVLVYLNLFIIVKQKERNIAPGNAKTSHAFTQRILKSLLWITCINIAGWCIATFSRIIHPYLFDNEIHSVMFVNAVSYLTNLTSASSGPVLYICSEEYRKAFKMLFGFKPDSNGTTLFQQTRQTSHCRDTMNPTSANQ